MALLVGGTLAVLFLELPWSAVVIAVLVGVEVFEFRVWRWAVRQRPRAGAQGIVGEAGILGEGGRVRIRGSSYPARMIDEGGPGDRVRVEDVDGMTLVVRRIADEDRSS